MLLVAEGITMTSAEHHGLVIDLDEDSLGLTFRATPAAIQEIENNLSLGNMAWEGFAHSTNNDGVVRPKFARLDHQHRRGHDASQSFVMAGVSWLGGSTRPCYMGNAAPGNADPPCSPATGASYARSVTASKHGSCTGVTDAAGPHKVVEITSLTNDSSKHMAPQCNMTRFDGTASDERAVTSVFSGKSACRPRQRSVSFLPAATQQYLASNAGTDDKRLRTGSRIDRSWRIVAFKSSVAFPTKLWSKLAEPKATNALTQYLQLAFTHRPHERTFEKNTSEPASVLPWMTRKSTSDYTDSNLIQEDRMQETIDGALLSRSAARTMLEDLLHAQSKVIPESDDLALSDLGFTSLDLAELTVRLEDQVGGEVALEAAAIRPLRTVSDLLDLLAELRPVTL
ncbi:acyl carrier protein [Saccharopolyspora pogona]|uniref:acyl carrier protein n=1 Tax=Saccharopolyspora pogona TaxID=333966 RepID=UPI001687B98B|nr:acyl carrier protein [Saccharopolyspora pogona]